MAKMDTDRFVRTMKEGSDWTTKREIWVDRQTGVNYLWVSSGYAGGLTPLLNYDGRPVITSVPTEK